MQPVPSEIPALIEKLALQARTASLQLATLDAARKNAALANLASLLRSSVPEIEERNRVDLEAAEAAGLTMAMIDRLRLDSSRIEKMATGIDQIIALPDPVGEVMETLSPPNGLDIRKVRVPIGVIGIIYESRPNVTIDCAALCLKSGNASILRGGKEAFHSNQILAEITSQALADSDIDPHAVQLIPTTDRAALNVLLKLNHLVHCIIPRGGESLIRFVSENSTIPVIKHFTGVCNAFLAASADPQRASSVIVNAKAQRAGVCNAIENLLVSRSAPQTVLIDVLNSLAEAKVELRVDQEIAELLSKHPSAIPYTLATDADWGTEYLDLILSVKMVSDCQQAVDFINHYGSGHSDVILTEEPSEALYFLNAVDGATVYWNASTRFTDGFEFGLGAEIGISTDRLHARGPMGLRELCSYKYLIYGDGQIRS
ncbi:MAG: glutamate-5-semialdehyde dehydrogenase [Puniceicoccaceae bacterium]